jgi:hypothetical protein
MALANPTRNTAIRGHLMNSIFHAKQAPAYDFGILAIKTIGGSCPEWAAGFPPVVGDPTVEICIVREAADDIAALLSLGETASGKAPRRILIVDDALSPQRFMCDGLIWFISAPASDLDTIAEACSRLADGRTDNGLNLTYAIDFLGGAGAEPHFGRGAAMKGVFDGEVERYLAVAERSFADTGYDRGAIYLQALAQDDDVPFEFAELGVHILNVAREPVLVAVYYGAFASAVITIAFSKPAATR